MGRVTTQLTDWSGNFAYAFLWIDLQQAAGENKSRFIDADTFFYKLNQTFMNFSFCDLTILTNAIAV